MCVQADMNEVIDDQAAIRETIEEFPATAK